MSSKVRIYELSKELNLDNRDILAVCDQLEISVKSHSSTISEEEAAKIRQAASRQFPNGSVAPVVARQRKEVPAKPVVAKAKEPGRQQILEVRRYTPQGSDDAESGPVAAAATAPMPPAAAPLQTPKAPTRPTASPSSPPSPSSPSPSSPSPEKAVIAEAPAAPERVELSPPPEISRPKEKVPIIRLSSPPARTEERKPPSLANKPVLRSAQTAQGANQGTNQGAKPSQADRPNRGAPGEIRPPRSRDEYGSAGNGSPGGAATGAATGPDMGSADRTPIPILLKKPSQPRPARPGTSEAGEGRRDSKGAGIDASDNDLIPVLIPGEEDQKLRRPTLNRPKRAKTEVEDDEMSQLLNKASKVGTKQKRRTKQDDEEEDLFNDDGANQTTVVDVSLSLARPPKQKTAKQSRPSPAASSRPSAPKPGGNRRSRRSDRQAQAQEPEKPTLISLTNAPTVQELANLLLVPETDVIRVLFLKGIAANINQTLDFPTATMVAEELGAEVETVKAESAARKVTEMLEVGDLESLQRRPPVVTIMGHVDHGKTTLLDSIRKTKVAQGEAGGITQHIGAYHVDLEHNGVMQQVVFLDTPGHEAFTAMRARGTRVTDIAILVVAADDGVRPQTIEAISHAQAAKVPIIVAINKMDKESAQPDRVKQELTEYGLVSEEWGGDNIMVPVSALKGDNLDTLLEMILLVSDVEDLHANPDRPAKGTVIEANLDKARGPVATLLVQNGTLRVGDVLVVGSVFGKVRAMIGDRGDRVDVASPSFAVEVLGLNDVPAAGDEFEVLSDEKEARAVASARADQQRQTRLQQAMSSRRISLGALSDQAREGELKELNIIIKADVQGSLEAILASLGQLPQGEVQVRVLFSAPGEVTETDVDLAAASNAVIIGFNTSLASGARQAADRAGVDIREYNIIYKLLEDIEGAMEGLLDPELVEEPLGVTEVRAVFPVGRGAVAGCYVQSGKLVRNCRVRVRRGKDVIFEGILDSLKRMKDDAKEVNFGYECGIRIDSFNEWKEGDSIESYQLVTKRRTLSMV
ncbi:MAG: translation initiation factor IF-2 [Thermosynechococcaceae cyanobacterium MS004]|nr:translation initiation factor IF-2 [Thermosynechococcaceae cyanobacterium MS004]